MGQKDPKIAKMSSLLADMIGTQLRVRPEFLKRISRDKSTCDLDFSVDRFGRISTSLKSSLMSLSILIIGGG